MQGAPSETWEVLWHVVDNEQPITCGFSQIASDFWVAREGKKSWPLVNVGLSYGMANLQPLMAKCTRQTSFDGVKIAVSSPSMGNLLFHSQKLRECTEKQTAAGECGLGSPEPKPNAGKYVHKQLF